MAPAPGSDAPGRPTDEAGPSHSSASDPSPPSNASHEAPKTCARCGQPLPESNEAAPTGPALADQSSALNVSHTPMGAPSPSSIAFAPPSTMEVEHRSAEQQRAFEAESMVMCAECRIAHASGVPRVSVTTVGRHSPSAQPDHLERSAFVGALRGDGSYAGAEREQHRSRPTSPSRRSHVEPSSETFQADETLSSRWRSASRSRVEEAASAARERGGSAAAIDPHSEVSESHSTSADGSDESLRSMHLATSAAGRETAVVQEIIQASEPLVRARTSSFSRSLHWPSSDVASNSRWLSESTPLVSIPHSRRETTQEPVGVHEQPSTRAPVAPLASQRGTATLSTEGTQRREAETSSTSGTSQLIDARWRSWKDYPSTSPDPRTDVSRLRMRSKGRGCLVPGATFVGTQRSGRSCYEVGVQIVNVDLEASHLCGYLNIRGLTEDWPELTTFFDAEIIGDRHSFVTNKWGAKEANDMTHWSRFAPFRSLRNKLDKTGLFDHMAKPYVFMRWKERFLVPDHRVRDIHGASFAGFYYVCVELGESWSSAARASAAALAAAAGATSEAQASSTPQRRGQTTLGGNAMMLDEDEGEEEEEEVAEDPNFDPLSRSSRQPLVPGRMTGFYYHANSEPYQQLALQHVPEASSGTFEMR